MALDQIPPEDVSNSSEDGRLVAAATRGEMEAFAKLYRRYAGQARGVARRVVDNEADAEDAVGEAFTKVLRTFRTTARPTEIDFRPYLLVATRHAAVDILRRRARVSPSRELEWRGSPTAFDQPDERAVANEEGRLIRQALSALSERDQLVLSLLEVEHRSVRATAEVVGLKPNHVAQIAARARKRLRRRYVRAHLRDVRKGTCGFIVEHLPAYLDDELSDRTRNKIDAHLAQCQHCQKRRDELGDLGITLRRALLWPSVLGAGVHKRWPFQRRTRLGFRRLADAVGRVPTEMTPDCGASLSCNLARGANTLSTVTGEVTNALGAAAPAVQQIVAAASATLLVLGASALGNGAAAPAGSSPPQRSQEVSVSRGASGGPGNRVFRQPPSTT